MRQYLFILCLLCVTPKNILEVAQSFLGIPYVAGTLEAEGDERLIINEDSLDCTTFVELSVARWLATQNDSLTFEQQVQAMRYRGGTIDGYLIPYFCCWCRPRW